MKAPLTSLIALACTALAASGQGRIFVGGGGDPARRDEVAPVVAESTAALGKLAEAYRLESLRRWEEAAALWSELVKHHANDLVPVDYEPTMNGAARPVSLYRRLEDLAAEHFAEAPDELRRHIRVVALPSTHPARRAAATAPSTRPATAPSTRPAAATRPVVPALAALRRVASVDLHLLHHLEHDRLASVFPVADAGQLFFHDGIEVWGLDVATGKPLPGWAKEHARRAGRYALSERVGPEANPVRQPAHTVALTDDALHLVMGTMRGPAAEPALLSGTVLVCIDRTTGAHRWFRRLTLGGPSPVEFTGTPAVSGDHVYAAWRSRPGVLPRSAGILCVERRTGRPVWQTRVATLDADVDEPWGAHVIASDDGASLFVQTDLGVIARLDAAGGWVVWAAVHPRESSRQGAAGRAFGGWNADPARRRDDPRAARPWHLAPPILTPTALLALPTSAMHVVALDPTTGRSANRIGREMEAFGEFSRAACLLDGDAKRVLLVADDRVFALAWPRYVGQRPDGRKLDIEHTHWIARFDRIAGRPALATDYVLVPAERAIVAVDLAKGMVRHRYPARVAVWPAGEAAGNLALADGHLVVATGDRVNLYATPAND